MITISDLKFHKDLPFEDYLKIPAISYSGLKTEGKEIKMTPKMAIGKKVHAYLFEPDEYDFTEYPEISSMGNELKQVLPLKHLQCELAFTCNMHYQGLKMAYKGRIDMHYPGIVIDLKISGERLSSTIKHFGYDRQLSGYCIATGSKKWIIISYNRKHRVIERMMGVPDELFWKQQILKHGTV